MTVKDIATRAGVSHQAVYQKLKKRGIRIEDLRDKETGELTGEGMAILLKLFPLADETVECSTNDESSKLEGAISQDEVIERLGKEIDRLKSELSIKKIQLEAITDERDFLRKAVEQSQERETLRTRIEALEAGQQAMLTDGGQKYVRGIFAWFRRHKGENDG